MTIKTALLLSLWPMGLFAGTDLPPLVLPEGVGVNIHFTRGREQDLDMIAAAGFKFIRMDFGWSGIERKKGEYDWSAYDELTANLEKRKLRPVYIFDYSHGLYEEAIVSKNPQNGKEQRDTASPQHPESVAAFARWAGAAAQHFAGHSIIWEIWNEPNIGFWKPKPDVKQYTALALATCQAVREANPRATIVGPATSEFPWAFLESFLSSGVLEYLDGVSVHPYRNYSRGPETAADEYLKLRGLIERYAPPGKKFIPILSGEWGYATHTKGVSLETQAAFIARQQLVNVFHGVPVSIWYDWKNDGNDPNYNENNFGTVSNNLALKPSYVAVQTLTRQLGGLRVARRLGTASADDFVLLLVNDAGTQKLAAWTTGKPHTFTFDAGIAAVDVSAVDGQGQPRAIKTAGPALALDLDIAPQYLTLKKRSRKLAAASAWRLAGPVPTLVEAGGAAVKIPVQVKNPFSEPLRVRLALGLPDRSAELQLRADLEVRAPGAKEIEFDLPAGQTLTRELAFVSTRRSPEQLEQMLRVDIADQSGAVLSAASEPLRFHLSNPLKCALAPAERELRLLIENPTRSSFTGHARVGAERRPVKLDSSTSALIVALPLPAAGTPVTATLAGADGADVSEPLNGRFQPLFPLGMKAQLDGDAKIKGTASVIETNAPGPGAPFAKAFRLDYSFEPGWKFAECKPASAKTPFTGSPRALGVWIYGNGSGHTLRARLLDTTGQCFQPVAPNLDWTGWRWVEFDLADLKKAGHWGGANDGQAHGALHIETLVLVEGGGKKTAGTIYFAGPAAVY